MRRALVVGVDDYPGNPLFGCVNDANSMAEVLKTHGNGSRNFFVKKFTSPRDAITRSMLREANQKHYAADCDVCLFYFSGHGLITSTGGYIVTTDARRYDEGVSMDDILTLANRSRIKDRIIILDCCHSGALGAATITGSNMALLGEGVSVLTACRDSESALESNGKGIFTALIVAALQGQAADLLGNITPGSLYAYVDRALAPSDKRPIFKTNVTRFTSLRSVAPPVPLETLRKICVYFPLPQDDH